MASSDSDGSELAQGWAAEAPHDPGPIKYRVEYISTVSPGVAPGLNENKDTSDTGDSAPGAVMEYVEVRLTQEAFESGSSEQRNQRKYHAHTRSTSYITILSPAVSEALRCVVDYYPSV